MAGNNSGTDGLETGIGVNIVHMSRWRCAVNRLSLIHI